VNRNNNWAKTSVGLQGQLVGRGGEGYNLSSCSQIMSGVVVDVGNDNFVYWKLPGAETRESQQ
jgi:hypothetical protein